MNKQKLSTVKGHLQIIAIQNNLQLYNAKDLQRIIKLFNQSQNYN